MIYISSFLSVLLGDIVMGVGRNAIVWCFAWFAASFPIAFINAGQMVILFSTIPFGILSGGFLADYVLESFMMTDNPAVEFLQMVVGRGAGSGMAVMFLCTGVLGALLS